MKIRLAKRMENLEPSVTLVASEKAKELKRSGVDVVSLTLGEPDFATPKNIQDAAITAITDGEASYYKPAAGIPELRQAIVKRTEEDYGVSYTTNQVVVTDGAKNALYVLFQALLDEGDEIIVPTPYWVSYGEQIKLATGKPIFIPTSESSQYKVSVNQLDQALTDKTRAIVLNSPANPTGSIYTKEELLRIGNWAVNNDVLIISDDIYGKLVYNGNTFVPIVSLSEEIKNQTIVINGVSKAYSMTGWRIGYVIGDESLIKAMVAIISQSTSNAAAASQYAALEALSGPQDSVEVMRQAFEERLNTIFPRVAALPGFSLAKPQGAFYLFPNVKEAMEACGYQNVNEFADALLEEAHVGVVTGTGFGIKDTIRLSYASEMRVLEEGVARIEAFLEKKSKKQAE